MTKLYGAVHTGNHKEALKRALVEAEKYFGHPNATVQLLHAGPYEQTFAGDVMFATDYVAWTD